MNLSEIRIKNEIYLVSILKDCTKDYYEVGHTRSVKVFSLFLLYLFSCNRKNVTIDRYDNSSDSWGSNQLPERW